jgi:hypothetical protein
MVKDFAVITIPQTAKRVWGILISPLKYLLRPLSKDKRGFFSLAYDPAEESERPDISDNVNAANSASDAASDAANLNSNDDKASTRVRNNTSARPRGPPLSPTAWLNPGAAGIGLSGISPSLYSFIQSEVWGLGFLR